MTCGPSARDSGPQRAAGSRRSPAGLRHASAAYVVEAVLHRVRSEGAHRGFQRCRRREFLPPSVDCSNDRPASDISQPPAARSSAYGLIVTAAARGFLSSKGRASMVTSERFDSFRALIAEISSTIEEQPWTPDFEDTIRRTIDCQVRPAHLQLQGDLTQTYEKMFGNIIVSTAKTVRPSAIISVFPGLSTAEIIA